MLLFDLDFNSSDNTSNISVFFINYSYPSFQSTQQRDNLINTKRDKI